MRDIAAFIILDNVLFTRFPSQVDFNYLNFGLSYVASFESFKSSISGEKTNKNRSFKAGTETESSKQNGGIKTFLPPGIHFILALKVLGHFSPPGTQFNLRVLGHFKLKILTKKIDKNLARF